MSLEGDVRAAAGRICEAEQVTVISHIDADGITSLSILMQAITRAGIEAVPAQVQSVVVALPARTPARPSGLFPGNPGWGVWWVAEVW